MATARGALESLLKERKLDVTLTSARPWFGDPETVVAPTGIAAVDAPLHGGLRRGHLSEIVGGASSGRTSVLCAALAAATLRGEVVALIDACDRFDPAAAVQAGVELSRLLWVRERGDAPRALKAMNLVLQAGGFGLVVLDVADVPARVVRQFPCTTWMRIARVIEGSQTAAVIIAAEHTGRSPGGATIAFEHSVVPRGIWAPGGDRARHLRALDIRPRVIAAR